MIQRAALGDPDLTTRMAALQLVERCPSPHSALFPRLLRDSDPNVQRSTVLAINQYASRHQMKIEDASIRTEIVKIIHEPKQMPSIRYQLSLNVIGFKGFTREEKVGALGVIVEILNPNVKEDEAFRPSLAHSSLRKLTGTKSVKGAADWLKWFESNKHGLLWDESKSQFILPAK
jgi:hypothetical protein